MSKNRFHKSHLSQLLNAFGISGIELADILHIDASLVSKWKNNKRSLKNNSHMLNSIADYFIALDSLSNFSILKTFLSPEYDILSTDSPDLIRTVLKRWLTSSITPSTDALSLHDFMSISRKGKEYSHLQFCGNEGKREAIMGLLKLALSLPPGQELWCLMQDTQKWFIEDEIYGDAWEAANIDFLERGNSIHILHTLDRQYNTLANSLLNWLPLYLTGKVTPYFSSYSTGQNMIFKSVIILKDRVLLYHLSPEDDSLETTTLAFTTPTLLEEAFRMIQIPFHYAVPLFVPYYLNDHYKYANFLSQMVNLDEQQYVFMRFPFVNVLSTEQIEEILNENQVNEDVKNNALKACQILKTDTRKNSGNYFRYLIPKSQLEALLGQEKIMLDVLSFFSGKPLHISNKTFRNLLRGVSSLLTSDSYPSIHEIVLLENVHVKQLKNLNMFVKKNTCISIFNSPEHFETQDPLILTTTESPIILSMFMYCDHLWNQTLPQRRNRAYVSRQLQIMTETIFPESSSPIQSPH